MEKHKLSGSRSLHFLDEHSFEDADGEQVQAVVEIAEYVIEKTQSRERGLAIVDRVEEKAAIYAKLGREEEASRERDRLLEICPDFSHAFWPEARKWQAPDEVIGALREGLKQSGLQLP